MHTDIQWTTEIETAVDQFPREYQFHANQLLQNQVYGVHSNANNDSQKQLGLFKLATQVLLNLLDLFPIIAVQPLLESTGTSYFMSREYLSVPKPTLILGVRTHAVESQVQPLISSWNLEAVQNQYAQQSADMEKELVLCTAYEIANNIRNRILNSVCDIAQQNNQKTQALLGISSSGLLVNVVSSARTQSFGDAIRTMVNDISSGIGDTIDKGYYVVCSPIIATTFQCMVEGFEPIALQPNLNGLVRIGIFDKTIDVYVSLSPAISDKVLVGYKGVGGNIDAGLFYMPYILVTTDDLKIDPFTFQHTATVSTIDTVWSSSSLSAQESTVPYDSKKYFRSVKVNLGYELPTIN